MRDAKPLEEVNAAVERFVASEWTGGYDKGMDDLLVLAKKYVKERGYGRGYDPMPADRPHPCHVVNIAGIPTEWVVYEEHQGFSLEGTNAYGDGYVTNITYCPWCGDRLHSPETEEKLNESGVWNRLGIRKTPPLRERKERVARIEAGEEKSAVYLPSLFGPEARPTADYVLWSALKVVDAMYHEDLRLVSGDSL